MNEVAQRAEALLDAGRTEQALSMLGAALASDPEDPELLSTMGWAQIGIDPAAAVTTAQALIRVAPDDPDGHLIAAHAHGELQHLEQCIAHVDQAERLDPDGLAVLSAIAVLASRRRSGFKRGEHAAQRALERYPDSASSHIAAGAVDLHRGRGRRAQAHFRQALALDPANSVARVNLAQAEQMSGQLASSFTNVQGQLAIDPNDASARDVLDQSVGESLVKIWVLLAATALAVHFGWDAVRRPAFLWLSGVSLYALWGLVIRPNVVRKLPWRYIRDTIRRDRAMVLVVVACLLCAAGAVLDLVLTGAGARVGTVIAFAGEALGIVVVLFVQFINWKTLRGH